jgi:hypothetical protein
MAGPICCLLAGQHLLVHFQTAECWRIIFSTAALKKWLSESLNARFSIIPNLGLFSCDLDLCCHIPHWAWAGFDIVNHGHGQLLTKLMLA